MPIVSLVCECVMSGLLQALSNVHEQRSHRDLKAGNVMVSGWQSMDGLKIHLIDWANSRRHDEGEQICSISQFLSNVCVQPMLVKDIVVP